MNLLYFTILLPLMNFLILTFLNQCWSKKISTIICTSLISLTSIITFNVIIDFYNKKIFDDHFIYTQTLWHWLQIDKLNIPITLILDGLSLTMLGIIINIGFLIHLYAIWYMKNKKGYCRFFAYINLFIASMVILILADNLMLMYLGWECVGLCSYLLIGFYFTNSNNGKAALKTFLITRIADIGLMIAIFILYKQFNTLNFNQLNILFLHNINNNSALINWTAFMILCGAIGKSAQLPLQTWLTEAMVGPTPVSAFIHAATMITAGVYLIARTHILFLITPNILFLIAIIGTITLLLGGLSALVQTDIKRILAYSTMSQIGYMFLSLGVKAWNAAIFHLMTHAFFKALLFLSAGSLIKACNNEQNIFRMGGLRKSLPFIYICFLIGGSSLSSIPLITAGFYSKDEILWGVFLQKRYILLLISIIGIFITSLYTFRMIFIIFHGKLQIFTKPINNIKHTIPLVILLILSTFLGTFITQPLEGVFIKNIYNINLSYKIILQLFFSIISLSGFFIAFILYKKNKKIIFIEYLTTRKLFSLYNNFSYQGFGFDKIYNLIFIIPFKFITQILEKDPINKLMNIPVILIKIINKMLIFIQNGKIHWYLMYMGFGSILLLILLLIM